MATRTITVTVSDLTGAEVEGDPYLVTVKEPSGKEHGPYEVTEHEATILTSGNVSLAYRRGRKPGTRLAKKES